MNIPKGSTYESLYLDYLNNFITVEEFADHYGLTESQADTVIIIGRAMNPLGVVPSSDLL